MPRMPREAKASKYPPYDQNYETRVLLSKCDGRRPSCSQCESRGEVCPGYRARFRFVSHTGAKLPYPAIDNIERPYEGSKPDKVPCTPEHDDAITLQLLPRNLVGTAKGIELLCRFEDIYKPRRRSTWQPLSTDLSDLPSWEWVLTVFQSSQDEPMLNDIVRALVLSSVGRCDKNTLYVQKGSDLHAKAVNTLKLRLQSESDRCSDHTLAAIMVFGMYEVQIGSVTRGNAWLAHVQGFETLLQMRSRSHKPLPMFVKKLIWASQYNRWVITMRARGKPGTAPAPILFDILEQSAPMDVKLFSILHRIAPLFAKVEHFREISHPWCEHQKSRIGLSLLADIYELEAELHAWPSGQPNPALLHWDESSTLYAAWSQLTDFSTIFAMAVCFSSVRVAIAMLFSWTGVLFVNIMKEMIINEISVENWIDSATSDSAETSDAEDDVGANTSGDETRPDATWMSDTSYSLAVRIARSIEYFLHPDMGQLGTYLIGFPLGVCQTYFEQRAMHDELLWLKAINLRMTEAGSGLSEFLQEMKNRSSLVRDDGSPWDT